MTDKVPKFEVSPLSREFTDQGVTVDVQIYKIGGNRGWTLEVVVDEHTAVVWEQLFPTDDDAWNDFAAGVQSQGLRELLASDLDEETTIH